MMEKMRWDNHEKLAYYEKDAYDIEYEFPMGYSELEGVHNRSDQTYPKQSIR